MTDQKKRGRKPIAEGGKSSPREIFCIFLKDGKMYKREVDGNQTQNNDEVLANAIKKFTDEFGVADQVEGPFFLRKGTQAINTKTTVRKAKPELAPEDIVFAKDQAVGQYKDFNVSIRLIEGHPDLGFAFFKDAIDQTKRKTTPNNQLVYLSDVEGLTMVVKN